MYAINLLKHCKENIYETLFENIYETFEQLFLLYNKKQIIILFPGIISNMQQSLIYVHMKIRNIVITAGHNSYSYILS